MFAEKTQAETKWNARCHMGQSLALPCALELCQGAGGRPGWVGHQRYAIVREKMLGAGVVVGERQSAFAVAEDELVLGGCARV